MVTIYDIAKKARVSVGTVSNVINNKPGIRPENKKTVLSAIEKLRYEPNVIARNLRSKRTYSIGLILPDITYPFFAQMARYVENKIIEQGYSIILCDSMDDIEKEKRYFQLLEKRWVDGVIFSGVKRKSGDNQHIRDFVSSNIPLLMIDRTIKGVPVCSVSMDNFEAAYRATEYLIKLGHRNIAFINHLPYMEIGIDRYKGFTAALKKNRIKIDSNMVKNFKSGNADYLNIGREGVRRLLKNSSNFTGIVALNDLIAIGAMQELESNKINVPADVSITGFDDIPLSAVIGCPLTTIKQPIEKMGEMVSELIVKMISKKKYIKKILSSREN